MESMHPPDVIAFPLFEPPPKEPRPWMARWTKPSGEGPSEGPVLKAPPNHRAPDDPASPHDLGCMLGTFHGGKIHSLIWKMPRPEGGPSVM